MPTTSPQIQAAMEELRRRGINLGNLAPSPSATPVAPDEIQTRYASEPRPVQVPPPTAPDQSLPPHLGGGQFPSQVALERNVRVKQLQGDLAVQDAVNELKRRGINLQLRTAPAAEEVIERGAKEAVESARLQGDPEAFKGAWRAFFPGKALPRKPDGTIDYAGGQDDIDVEIDRKKRLEAAKVGVGISGDLRKEYSALKEVHDFGQVDAAYKKLITATEPTAATSPLRDQAAIFSWMKILDPGSTVREGEYASVKNARGVPDSIRNWYNQALTGQLLTTEQRTQLREAATPVYQGQVDNLLPRIRQFETQARGAGLNPSAVIPTEHLNFLKGAVPSPTGTAAPAAGAAAPTAGAAAPVQVNSAAEAPPTAKFIRSPSGRVYRNPKYTGP